MLIGVAIEEYQEIHSMDMPESILKRELANFTSFVIQNFLIKTYTIQIYFWYISLFSSLLKFQQITLFN